MSRKAESTPLGRNGHGLSRREVLVGAAAAALAASAVSTAATPKASQRGPRKIGPPGPARRYLAAAAMLGDGRILVTGGYNRPIAPGERAHALNSTLIFEPRTGEFFVGPPMRVPRARHAAVALRDGRVAVLGGTSMQPTASVEIYDPASDSWTSSRPLAQPRYDHMAVSSGAAVFVIGGTSLSMVSSVETVFPDSMP